MPARRVSGAGPGTLVAKSPEPLAEISIRRAVPDDLGALGALENAVFTTERLSRRSWRRLLVSPSAAVIVGTRDTQIVGCAVVLFRRNSRRARLYSISRLARDELRGLGGRLLAAAEHCANCRGCHEISLEVQVDNMKALRLYERAGYRAVAHLPAYYAMGRDGTRMVKSLDSATR